jgi:hypothetical protein
MFLPSHFCMLSPFTSCSYPSSFRHNNNFLPSAIGLSLWKVSQSPDKVSICRDLQPGKVNTVIDFSAAIVGVIAECTVDQTVSSGVRIVVNAFKNCLLPSQRRYAIRVAPSTSVTFALVKFRLCFHRDRRFRLGLRFLRTVPETRSTGHSWFLLLDQIRNCSTLRQ